MLLTCVAALLIAAPAASADGTYEVTNADSVYVRPKPQSWVVGTLYRVGPNVAGPEHMDVQEISPGGWAYGYVYGAFHGCGWVDAKYVRKINATVGNRCSTDPSVREPSPDDLFSDYSDPAHPNGRNYHTVACASPGAYGNYRAGTFSNKYGDLPANHAVDWRYTSKDEAAVLVKDTSNGVGAPPWFFVRAECVAPGNPTPTSTPPPPAPPAPTPPTPTPVPTPPSAPAPRAKTCWKTSASSYCKHLRRRCRRAHNHSARCRRALHGVKKR
jgi:hypothetical protein